MKLNSLEAKILRLKGQYPLKEWSLPLLWELKSPLRAFSSIQLARRLMKHKHSDVLKALHGLRDLGHCKIVDNRWVWVNTEGEQI